MLCKRNLKAYGFKTCDSDVGNLMEKSLSSFLKKKASQNGGRVTMPAQYFGVNDNLSYVASPTATTQETTSEWARPPVSMHSIEGGRVLKFKISKKHFKDACQREVMGKMSKQHCDYLQSVYEEKMDKALQKISKGGNSHLSVEQLTNVLNQKNYRQISP